jgi:putative transposase
MSTHHSLYNHLIWSTKNREPLINELLETNLYQYISGIIRKKKGSLIKMGGMPDHVHLLIGLEPDIAISNIVKDIKVNSTRWMRNQAPAFSSFAWQEGFGVFSVSKSNTDAVVNYIENQKEHHQSSSFENEFVAFLDKHEIEYDPKYVFA